MKSFIKVINLELLCRLKTQLITFINHIYQHYVYIYIYIYIYIYTYISNEVMI
jgi:hypothetical protein